MKDVLKKPGWKTSEFWITLVVIIAAAVVASGAVGEESGLGKVLVGVLALAQSLGYTMGRVFTKTSAAKALGDLAAEAKKIK